MYLPRRNETIWLWRGCKDGWPFRLVAEAAVAAVPAASVPNDTPSRPLYWRRYTYRHPSFFFLSQPKHNPRFYCSPMASNKSQNFVSNLLFVFCFSGTLLEKKTFLRHNVNTHELVDRPQQMPLTHGTTTQASSMTGQSLTHSQTRTDTQT